MSTTNTPNMNLVLPGVGTEAGPDYATEINNDLTLLDAHDHSSGSGVPVTPSGLNINTDLSINGNAVVEVSHLDLTTGTVSVDARSLSSDGIDLFFTDASGNQIQITDNGGVAGTPGSIANLAPPASATYVSGSQTFVWQSDANTPANMDNASITIRNLSAGANGVTVNAPAALGANYNITLPLTPNIKKIMTMDATGTQAAEYVTDNSTIEISSNTIQVKALGIGTAQLADASVTAAKLATGIIDGEKVTSITTVGTTMFTVPANTRALGVKGAGGGGGGGNGTRANGSVAGGSGGTGCTPIFYKVNVTPGEVITVVIGDGGAGGTVGTGGASGSTGQSTTVSGSFGTLTFLGSAGGLGGVVNTPGAAVASTYNIDKWQNASAAGGVGGANGANAAAAALTGIAGGTGGSQSGGDKGGGGGGGPGAGVGGAGGAGQTSGVAAAANTSAGGGGAGAVSAGTATAGGGKGGSGIVYLYYTPGN